MTETPREYKKRIDEKWQKNEKNKEKLIQKIEAYDLLDELWKSRAKQEILDNFQKNQKAEKEGEKYITIVSELGKVDQKYEELTEMREKLKSKKDEKAQVEKEIRESKLDGTDETTLKIQISGMRKLKEKLKEINSQIEEYEKEIQNRQQELKEIEETYGEKVQDSTIETSGVESPFSPEGQVKLGGNPITLKEYQEQTIQELWNKDRVRGQIFKILDEGAGIDDDLKDKIKKEISDRFFEYYNEKQGSLRMKSARFMKNKLKKGEKKTDEILSMPEGEEKEGNLSELDRYAKIYGGGVNTIQGAVMLKQFREIWKKKMNIYEDTKEKIIKSFEKIPVRIEKQNDGSRLITLRLSGKTYHILVVENVYSHSDDKYINKDGKLREKGISGNNIDKWENQKLKEYVKQKEKEGLHIPKKEELRELLGELGKQAELSSNEYIQIAMLMYLTGMQGEFFIDMYSSSSRNLIYCKHDLKYSFCYYPKHYTRAPLLLYCVSS